MDDNQNEFDILQVNEDTIVQQIIFISSDLFKQVRIQDLIDLRYQKSSKFARSLNKLLDFSNKVCSYNSFIFSKFMLLICPFKLYLFVPTTILRYDDARSQLKSVKKWISIASVRKRFTKKYQQV